MVRPGATGSGNSEGDQDLAARLDAGARPGHGLGDLARPERRYELCARRGPDQDSSRPAIETQAWRRRRRTLAARGDSGLLRDGAGARAPLDALGSSVDGRARAAPGRGQAIGSLAL